VDNPLPVHRTFPTLWPIPTGLAVVGELYSISAERSCLRSTLSRTPCHRQYLHAESFSVSQLMVLRHAAEPPRHTRGRSLRCAPASVCEPALAIASPLDICVAQRCNCPVDGSEDLTFTFVVFAMVMMHMWIGDPWYRATVNSGVQKHLLKPVERPVGVDKVVSVEYDCRVVAMRVEPHIVTCVFDQEAPEALEELLYLLASQARTLVTTEHSTSPRCVQDVKDLGRA